MIPDTLFLQDKITKCDWPSLTDIQKRFWEEKLERSAFLWASVGTKPLA